jgi:hypothetical protein
MTLSIDLSPQTSERLSAAAKMKGVDPQTLLATLADEYLPPIALVPADPRPTTRSIDPENDASIALLESWLAEAQTDADEIREAEEDLAEVQAQYEPSTQAGRCATFVS